MQDGELVQLIPTLFFLVALVLVAKFRTRISSRSREGYRNIAGGLSLLSLVTLVQLYRDLGWFDSAPFLSEPLFFSLAIWVAVLTGVLLMANGASGWLPPARSSSEQEHFRLHRLELLKKIEQLATLEGRLDRVLRLTLEYIVDHFELSFGVVLTASNETNQFTVHSLSPKAPSALRQCYRVRAVSPEKTSLEVSGPAEATKLLEGYPEQVGKPQLALPVVHQGKLLGLFLLWCEGTAIVDDEAETILRLVGDIVARRVSADQSAARMAEIRNRHNRLRKVKEELAGLTDAREILPRLISAVNEVVPVEYLSVQLPDDQRATISRYSIGPSGQVLVEHGLATPDSSTPEGAALRNGERLIISNDSTETAVPSAPIDERVHATVIEPVKSDGVTLGIVTLAGSDDKLLDDRSLKYLGRLQPVLGRFVRNERSTTAHRTSLKHLGRVGELAARIGEVETVALALKEGARLLFDELSVDAVRITTVDHDHKFLKSRALVCDEHLSAWVPESGEMILDLMPLHRQVIERGRIFTGGVGEESLQITEMEAKQVFSPEMTSLCIIPITVASRIVGLISLSTEQRGHRLSSDEASLALAGAVAGVLAGAIDLSRASRQAWCLSPGAAAERQKPAPDDLRNRLKSPVTGLMGSLELIKSRTGVLHDEGLRKYLSMLDRSARSIDDFVRAGE